jgi:NADP-dependent 3-hydroxy acid dehydrogenase YdfG
MNGPRTALVSGASRGIGLAIARELVGRGLRVVMVARTASVLRAAASELGPNAVAVACDVSDEGAVSRMLMAAAAELDGAPDVLVNNAGLFKLAAAADADPNDFARALATNLVAPFRLIRGVLPAMRERRRGHIVSIGSIADRVAFAENGAYAAGKFGLRGLHAVLRAELANTGVRTTLVSPGPVDTELWDEVDPDNRPGFTPRASMLRADAVAAAVAFAVMQPPDVNIDELRLSHS